MEVKAVEKTVAVPTFFFLGVGGMEEGFQIKILWVTRKSFLASVPGHPSSLKRPFMPMH